MAEFDKDGEWHKRRCPYRVFSLLCQDVMAGHRWDGNGAFLDYGPNREFVGKTCEQVWRLEQSFACDRMEEEEMARAAEEEQRRAAAAPAEEWRVVTEGVVLEGDRCTSHPTLRMPVGDSIQYRKAVGCVIERRVAAEPAAAPEAAPADAPAEQVVGVKAWSLSFTEGAKLATPLNPLTPSEKWAKTHSVLSPAHPEYADDAALGRLVRTLVEQGRAVWFQGDGLKGSILVSPTGSARPSNHGGSILTALVVSAGRAVLAEGGAK